MSKYKHIFGPVQSRRFGRSLGVDLTPGKTCTMNCVFCQLGKTETLTAERREYVSTAEVLSELEHWAKHGGTADCVTLAGSGEPTLHLQFGKVLRFIRQNLELSAILLSNGSTFHDPEVRAAACEADIVKLSLSAWDQPSFERINRASPRVPFERIVEGQKAFRAEFTGELRLEVFVIEGINSGVEDMAKIAALAAEIRPDVVQLNTAVRPVAEPAAIAASVDQMQRLARVFEPPAEVIAAFPPTVHGHMEASHKAVLALLTRHPATAAEIAASCGVPEEEAGRILTKLVDDGKVATDERTGGTYYSPS